MQNNAHTPLLLCASPRRGNCLEAANLFAEGFNAAHGAVAKHSPPGADVVELAPTCLRDFRIEPCIDCGSCYKGKSCPFLDKDDSAELLESFLHAPMLAIVAPIYFYHLPAQLKALLDRCQQYYAWKELGVGGLDALPKRKAFIVLAGARQRGDQLFTGSLLTLKLALAPFNISLKAPLLLNGLDAPGDIGKRPDYFAALRAYGAETAQSIGADS